MAHQDKSTDFEKRFHEYLGRLAKSLNHRDRHEPLKAYIKGLCLSGERKSIEPMAAKIDPFHVQARHQSMHHFVANATWNDTAVLSVARDYVLEPMHHHGGVLAWVVDDTGNPKKGNHSAGVARQYCGQLGKTENCQVAVSISLANEAISIPAAYQLYLPESWIKDPNRRQKTGIPKNAVFKPKWQIALDNIARLRDGGVPTAPVLADAGYGNATGFRDQLTDWHIPYVVGINPETTVWQPGTMPLLPIRIHRRGRPPIRLRRDAEHKPLDALTVAMRLDKTAWKDVTWREGTKGKMTSRFAALRIRPAHCDTQMTKPRDEEWLLIEWPRAEKKPTKFWLSTMPADIKFEEIVRTAKMRWRIERDYEELKDEFGLNHFEGRGWRGFHHHASLCIAAYAFMAAERARFSPSGVKAIFKATPLPKSFRPRGSPDTP